MDFSWTEEQLAYKQRVIDFTRNELLLNVERDAVEPHGEVLPFPLHAWKQCADFGIQGLCIPVEYGGQGKDSLSAVLALEGFGYACHDLGLSYSLSAQMWSLQPALLHFGSEAQKQQYLTPLCRAEKMGAFAMTEPGTGSDTSTLKTTAEKKGGTYIINGTKEFVTFGPSADFAVVFAATNPEQGRWGISAFIVQRGTAGFEQSDALPKLGLHNVPLGEFTFTDCIVDESQRLGPEGVGMSLFAKVMEAERAYILAPHLGIMQRQLEQALAFAKERKQFGQSIGKNQSVSNRLVDMKMRLELAKLLAYKTAWLDATDQPTQMEASLTKLHVGESLVASSLDLIRTFGARGYMKKYGVHSDLTDSVGGLIYGGTADIQRVVIARLLGL
ncbi:MAG: acyl-CoA dehydrogenase family protein [Pseudomonadales bacterium]